MAPLAHLSPRPNSRQPFAFRGETLNARSEPEAVNLLAARGWRPVARFLDVLIFARQDEA